MARASTATLIPLDRVAAVMQIDPYHFNSIYTAARPLRANCDDGWYQYGWQTAGKVSREELATALKEAEDTVISYLGWSFLPQWFSEEHLMPRHYRTEMGSFYAAAGNKRSIMTNWGYVVDAGRRATTFIENVSTEFSDDDGDGFEETVSITFATDVTEPEELRVYYPDKNGRDEWEIRPVTSIEIADGSATITFPRYMIPLEALLNAPPDPDDPHIAINGDDESNFLDSVDVYRVYTDASQQILFYYDPPAGCAGGPCEEVTETGCIFIKDSRLGLLQYDRADWDAETQSYTNARLPGIPVKAKVYYRAGWRDERLEYPLWQQVDPNLERRIIFYALSLLDRELCGCSNTRNIWQYMSEDMAKITPERSYTFPWDLTGNPLGTSRAAIQLWKYIHPLRLSQSSHKR